jgi:hypothetical protein
VSLAKSDSSTPLIADSVPSSLDHSSTTSGPGPCHRVCIWTRRHRTSCCSKPCAKPNHYMLYASIPITPNWSNTSGALSCRQRPSADTSNLPCYSSPATGSHVSSFTHSRSAFIRGYGATAARLTPDQKVASSNLSGLTFSLRGIFSRATQEFGLIFVLQEHQHFCSPWAYFMARSGHLPISIGTARTLENCGRKCLGNNMDQIIVPDIRLEWLCEWARTRKGSRDASTQFRGDLAEPGI